MASGTRSQQPQQQQAQAQQPQQQQAQAQQQVVFSLTPGTLDGTAILDYKTKMGQTLYKDATSKLSAELYDCSPDGYLQFMKSLKVRAEAFGWSEQDRLLWIEPSTGANKINLITDYGRISLERIQAVEDGRINQETRLAQDNRALYECLNNSLTTEGLAKVRINEAEYMRGNPLLPSGLLFLKIVIRESYLDSNATSSMIRTQLTNLDTYIGQVGNDINKFNKHVQTLLEALNARGETTTDLLTNLFKGYAACSDKTFVRYISDKQAEYEEGRNFDPVELMVMAETKYKILKTKDIWEAPSEEETKLIALEGGPKKKAQKTKYAPKPDFLRKPPADFEISKPKEWNGATWHWCHEKTGGKCGGYWRTHKPSECKGTARNKGRKVKAENSKLSKPDDKDKKVLINEAISTIQGGYQSEE
jgi:hypothetical protein